MIIIILYAVGTDQGQYIKKIEMKLLLKLQNIRGINKNGNLERYKTDMKVYIKLVIYGNVKNAKTNKQLYKNYNKTNNYLFVNLGRNNKKYIHRLVYETFKGFNNNKNIINHKNSNKTDNRLCNLEECNYSYNLIYAYYNGERKLKPVNQYSLCGSFINTYLTAKEAFEKTRVSRSGICNCCKGKIKTAGGYIWKYKTEVKQ